MEIPVYNSQPTGIALGPTPQADTRPSDNRVSSLASGFSSLAAGLGALSAGEQYQQEALRRSQEQADVTRTTVAISGANAELKQTLTRDVADFYNDPNGLDLNKINDLTARYHKMIGEASTKLQEQASTTRGKALVQTHMAALWADHYLPQVMAAEAKGRADYAISNIDGTIANAAYGVGSDPSMFGPMMSLAEESIRGSENLPEPVQREKLRKAQTEIAWAAVNTTIRSNPALIAVRTKGPLAQQPALAGVTGTAPYVAAPPVEGAPIGPPVDAPAAALADMQKQPSLNSYQGKPIYKDVDGVIRYGTAPSAAPTKVEPPAPPPTDEEIAKGLPAWKYLTPEARQTFRNQAATLLNQQGAAQLTAAKQRLADMKVAAENFIPDPNPPTHDWYVAHFGENSREEASATSMQMAAHVAQQMKASPDVDNLALAATLKPSGSVSDMAPRMAAYNMVSALARSTAKEQTVVLNNDIQQQLQKALAGADPGAALPVERFKNAGLTVEDHTAYLKDLAVYKQRVGATDLPNDQLTAMVDAQRVTADSPDAIAQQKRYDLVNSVATDIAKARKDDPSGFVLGTNPGIRALYDKAQQSGDPLDYNAYAQATKAEQLRLTGTFSLTTKADRQNISAMLTKPFTPNDTATSRVQQLAKQFGPNWAQVAVEFQQDPKASIPSFFYGTVGTDLPYAQAKAAQLAGIDIKELRKDVDPSRIALARAAMLREFAPMFSGLGVTPGNQTPLAGLLEVAEKGMLADLRSNANLSPDQAAKQNVAPYVGMYTYVPNRGQAQSNQQYMVPNDQDPAKVIKGVERVLDRVPQFNLPVPTDLSGRYKPEEAAKEWGNDVQTRPVWALNKSGDGLILSAVDRFGTMHPVLTPSGQQFGYSFSALREDAEAAPSGALKDMAAGGRRRPAPYVPPG